MRLACLPVYHNLPVVTSCMLDASCRLDASYQFATVALKIWSVMSFTICVTHSS